MLTKLGGGTWPTYHKRFHKKFLFRFQTKKWNFNRLQSQNQLALQTNI